MKVIDVDGFKVEIYTEKETNKLKGFGNTPIRIGHRTRRLQASEKFEKLQECLRYFMVHQLVELLNLPDLIETGNSDNFVKADTIALQRSVLFYPNIKSELLNWFVKELPENNMKIKRIENLIKN